MNQSAGMQKAAFQLPHHDIWSLRMRAVLLALVLGSLLSAEAMAAVCSGATNQAAKMKCCLAHPNAAACK
jgi:hypothetical protein